MQGVSTSQQSSVMLKILNISRLNTQNLVNTFTEQFKTNYTNWVETEANKTKEKE